MSEQTDLIQKRVNDLCNDFLIKGVKITSRLILSEMPDIKSTSTIHKYLKAWKDATKQNQATLYDHLGFSPEFTQSFAKEIARFGVEAERRHEAASIEAIEQRDEAIKGLEKAEGERDKQAETIVDQAAELQELRSEISGLLKKGKADIEAEKKANEATTKELRSQLAELVTDNKSLLQSNETLRTNLAKAELQIENNKEYVDTVKAQVIAATEQNKQLNDKVLELSSVGARLGAELAGSEKLIGALQSQDTQYQTQVTELRDHNNELRTELKESKNSLTALTEKLEKQAAVIQEYKAIIKENEKPAATHDANGKLIQ